MPLSKLETRGSADLLLTMYVPSFQGKIKFELFLKFKKCSYLTINFFWINSKKKTLGVKKYSQM